DGLGGVIVEFLVVFVVVVGEVVEDGLEWFAGASEVAAVLGKELEGAADGFGEACAEMVGGGRGIFFELVGGAVHFGGGVHGDGGGGEKGLLLADVGES